MITDENATRSSLADFYLSDSPDPLEPSKDWRDWRRMTAWASSLYEQSLLDGPRPITRLETGEVINMTSYNYLGMAHDHRVLEGAEAALRRYGAGACGSPLLSGMTDLHRELERRMAAFLGRADCLLFTSGYGGALGTVSGLLRKGDVALLDERSHTSLVDGVKLSGAKLVFFAHNDPDDLDCLLTRHEGARRIVAVEGIYSLDGDLGDLPGICAVADRHDVGVVVDEAHSILTLGRTGRGAFEHFGCDQGHTLQYGTFSKAFAGVGGFVAGGRDLLDYLRCFAASYGFSCALPPSVVGGLIAVLDIMLEDRSRIQRLARNADFFRAGLHELGVDTGDSSSHVVPIIVGDDRRRLYELGTRLRDRGLFLAPVDYPAVPEDSLRFRASVTASHTEDDLRRALTIIRDVAVPGSAERSQR